MPRNSCHRYKGSSSSEDFEMDLAVSAVTGDLAGRFISFLTNKCWDHVCSEEKVERLQQLLLRVHTVVEEADGRYITNSCMLIQLKKLSAAMYQGHHALDNIRCRQPTEASKEPVSGSSFPLSVFKRCRTSTTGATSSANQAFNSELPSALRNLEGVVANMVEFVILLGGCERISPRPYDAYLHVDHFVFGRHVEKQQILDFLLQPCTPGPPAPAVLPITGGRGVGKRTLVAHVCGDDRVRSHFTDILHMNGDDDLFTRITEHQRALIVVEFVSDVDDDDWTAFYSSITSMVDRGSKVIVLGRNESLKKLGTVKPISLSCLPFEEYRYLFKTLAFGSADPIDHPRLVPIVEEFATVLGGSLISANFIAHAMRKNPDPNFWLCKLNRVRATVKLNMSRFGVNPNELFNRGRPVHLRNGDYLLSPGAPSCLKSSASSPSNALGKNLPRMVSWDILEEAGRIVLPKGDFELISWESRLPPYTSFGHLVHFVPDSADDKPATSFSGKKRPGLSV